MGEVPITVVTPVVQWGRALAGVLLGEAKGQLSFGRLDEIVRPAGGLWAVHSRALMTDAQLCADLRTERRAAVCLRLLSPTNWRGTLQRAQSACPAAKSRRREFGEGGARIWLRKHVVATYLIAGIDRMRPACDSNICPTSLG